MMVRKQFYFTEKQDEFLKRQASLYGINSAEMLRRILDQYMEKRETEGLREAEATR